jgi:hypothetical protein
MVLSINVHYHWKDVKEVIKIVCCNLCMFDMCICNASSLIMFWKMKKERWTILEVNVKERIIKWIKDHYNSSFIKVEMSIFMMIMTWKKIIKILYWILEHISSPRRIHIYCNNITVSQNQIYFDIKKCICSVLIKDHVWMSCNSIHIIIGFFRNDADKKILLNR